MYFSLQIAENSETKLSQKGFVSMKRRQHKANLLGIKLSFLENCQAFVAYSDPCGALFIVKHMTLSKKCKPYGKLFCTMPEHAEKFIRTSTGFIWNHRQNL